MNLLYTAPNDVHTDVRNLSLASAWSRDEHRNLHYIVQSSKLEVQD